MVSIKVRRNCSINKCLLAPTTTKLCLQHGEPFDTGREQGRCVSAGLTANTSLWGHSLGFGAAPCPPADASGGSGPRVRFAAPPAPAQCPPWQGGVRRRRKRVVHNRQKGESWPRAIQGFGFAVRASCRLLPASPPVRRIHNNFYSMNLIRGWI